MFTDVKEKSLKEYLPNINRGFPEGIITRGYTLYFVHFWSLKFL